MTFTVNYGWYLYVNCDLLQYITGGISIVTFYGNYGWNSHITFLQKLRVELMLKLRHFTEITCQIYT